MLFDFPKQEQKILKFWQEKGIFKKSIGLRKNQPNFIFYEGPPTANAKPGIHHVLSRAFKDLIPRYKTMQGFKVLRRAGWDTHGLPVEIEIEKKLGLKSKKDIEKYGIDKFNEKCKESVWEYVKDWEMLTERIGYWLDMKNPYITYSPDYIETVWFILKQIWRKDLLYEDFKVVPYCPRCQTVLSSHEVAQGYKRIKEPAIYVKFEIRNSKFETNSKFKNQKSKIHLLVWTTTPWTLPGNMATAVNPKFTYLKVKINDDYLILSKARMKACGIEGKILEEFKGKDLIGLRYQPIYPYFHTPEYESKKVYTVLEADFISLEEGTGLVHIAPAFGQEDLELIRDQKEQFPIFLNVDEQGKFTEKVKKWRGELVTDEKLNEEIIEELEKRNLLFKKETHEHDYPFCWRCESKLIYYAKKSWFIKMTAVKEQLLKSNQQINWIPAHLKEGRFGEWLKKIKDWALSRERFWGTPLPIWQCHSLRTIGPSLKIKNQKSKIKNQKPCNTTVIIGSRKDLLKQKFTTNQYYILRHGQTIYQKEKKEIIYPPLENDKVCLTEKGKREIEKAAQKLKKEKIDLIFSSDFFRTRQTAEIVAKELKIGVKFDKRLRDVNLGIYHGRQKKEFYQDFPRASERFYKRPQKGETWSDCKKRMLDFIKEIDKKYQGKRILIVSHGDPLWLLEGAMKGLKNEEYFENNEKIIIKTGELRKIDFKIFPFNEERKLDFHRPYIDQIKFFCPKCKNLMKRVPEVIDCWFDAGSMPFAQSRWLWEIPNSKFPGREADSPEGCIPNKSQIPKSKFPADYICEGIDQTRGWFYTLLAISTLLGYGPAYKNVISLGLVLDEKGEKMSKSKGNVVRPEQILEKYGSDSVRWYFFTVNQPGDAKLFSEKELSQALRKFIMIYWNSFAFFETYVPKKEFSIFNFPRSKTSLLRGRQFSKSRNVLDKWIISKLNELIQAVTNSLDKYDITAAARAIENFVIENLSLWYIRRSRKRFQHPQTKKEFEEAATTLRFVLLTLTKLTAPFIPFLSEKIYQELQSRPQGFESVHLEDWPKTEKSLIYQELEEQMSWVREVVGLGLKARVKEKIKVRQPLTSLKIKNQESRIRNNKELIELIKEELNVEEVIFDDKIKNEVGLDTRITPGLKEKGDVREIIRSIQELRKKAGLTPKDKITISFSGSDKLNQVLIKNKALISAETGAEDLQSKEKTKEVFDIEKEIEIGDTKLRLAIRRA